jgi:hypothetical protein
MNIPARLAIVGTCAVLCAAATLVANSARDGGGTIPGAVEWFGTVRDANSYQRVASESPQKLTFRKLEAVVRRHALAVSSHARMEFGSVRVTGKTALVQVLFLAPDGAMCPVVYKLSVRHNSWRVVNVQRLWFIPHSSLLRGVKA